MAHSQRLEAEVKTMRIKVEQLEEALTSALASSDKIDIFRSSSPSLPNASEDMEDIYESMGSFSIRSYRSEERRVGKECA